MWISKKRFKELEKRVAGLEKRTQDQLSKEITFSIEKGVTDAIIQSTKNTGRPPLSV